MRDGKVSKAHEETKIYSWQESWNQVFAAERQCIQSALASAGLKVTVYHVGSTAVKGMVSKPIIDILICLAKDYDLRDCLRPLESIGYNCLGECGRKGRLFLVKGNEENKMFYLHLCYEDHQVARDQLLFRQILRNDVDVYCNYLLLKIELAVMFPDNRNKYCEMKGRYVNGVLASYRLGEKSFSTGDGAEVDEQIKYWIYQYDMTDEFRNQFEAACAAMEMTPDELIAAAIECACREGEADPEKLKQRCIEVRKNGEEMRLVRCYPVYKGETEAQALKRKLAEESSEAGGRNPGLSN